MKERLAGQAAAESVSERALLERLLAEGLDCLDHPGIVYRDGPTGRRAALAVGPDVWQIVSALRYTVGSQQERVAQLAEQFGLHDVHIRAAIDFAAAHRGQIDAEVAANDAAAQREQARSKARDELLAS